MSLQTCFEYVKSSIKPYFHNHIFTSYDKINDIIESLFAKLSQSPNATQKQLQQIANYIVEISQLCPDICNVVNKYITKLPLPLPFIEKLPQIFNVSDNNSHYEHLIWQLFQLIDQNTSYLLPILSVLVDLQLKENVKNKVNQLSVLAIQIVPESDVPTLVRTVFKLFPHSNMLNSIAALRLKLNQCSSDILILVIEVISEVFPAIPALAEAILLSVEEQSLRSDAKITIFDASALLIIISDVSKLEKKAEMIFQNLIINQGVTTLHTIARILEIRNSHEEWENLTWAIWIICQWLIDGSSRSNLNQKNSGGLNLLRNDISKLLITFYDTVPEFRENVTSYLFDISLKQHLPQEKMNEYRWQNRVGEKKDDRFFSVNAMQSNDYHACNAYLQLPSLPSFQTKMEPIHKTSLSNFKMPTVTNESKQHLKYLQVTKSIQSAVFQRGCFASNLLLQMGQSHHEVGSYIMNRLTNKMAHDSHFELDKLILLGPVEILMRLLQSVALSCQSIASMDSTSLILIQKLLNDRTASSNAIHHPVKQNLSKLRLRHILYQRTNQPPQQHETSTHRIVKTGNSIHSTDIHRLFGRRIPMNSSHRSSKSEFSFSTIGLLLAGCHISYDTMHSANDDHHDIHSHPTQYYVDQKAIIRWICKSLSSLDDLSIPIGLDVITHWLSIQVKFMKSINTIADKTVYDDKIAFISNAVKIIGDTFELIVRSSNLFETVSTSETKEQMQATQCDRKELPNDSTSPSSINSIKYVDVKLQEFTSFSEYCQKNSQSTKKSKQKSINLSTELMPGIKWDISGLYGCTFPLELINSSSSNNIVMDDELHAKRTKRNTNDVDTDTLDCYDDCHVSKRTTQGLFWTLIQSSKLHHLVLTMKELLNGFSNETIASNPQESPFYKLPAHSIEIISMTIPHMMLKDKDQNANISNDATEDFIHSIYSMYLWKWHSTAKSSWGNAKKESDEFILNKVSQSTVLRISWERAALIGLLTAKFQTKYNFLKLEDFFTQRDKDANAVKSSFTMQRSPLQFTLFADLSRIVCQIQNCRWLIRIGSEMRQNLSLKSLFKPSRQQHFLFDDPSQDGNRKPKISNKLNESVWMDQEKIHQKKSRHKSIGEYIEIHRMLERLMDPNFLKLEIISICLGNILLHPNSDTLDHANGGLSNSQGRVNLSNSSILLTDFGFSVTSIFACRILQSNTSSTHIEFFRSMDELYEVNADPLTSEHLVDDMTNEIYLTLLSIVPQLLEIVERLRKGESISNPLSNSSAEKIPILNLKGAPHLIHANQELPQEELSLLVGLRLDYIGMRNLLLILLSLFEDKLIDVMEILKSSSSSDVMFPNEIIKLSNLLKFQCQDRLNCQDVTSNMSSNSLESLANNSIFQMYLILESSAIHQPDPLMAYLTYRVLKGLVQHTYFGLHRLPNLAWIMLTSVYSEHAAMTSSTVPMTTPDKVSHLYYSMDHAGYEDITPGTDPIIYLLKSKQDGSELNQEWVGEAQRLLFNRFSHRYTSSHYYSMMKSLGMFEIHFETFARITRTNANAIKYLKIFWMNWWLSDSRLLENRCMGLACLIHEIFSQFLSINEIQPLKDDPPDDFHPSKKLRKLTKKQVLKSKDLYSRLPGDHDTLSSSEMDDRPLNLHTPPLTSTKRKHRVTSSYAFKSDHTPVFPMLSVDNISFHFVLFMSLMPCLWLQSTPRVPQPSSTEEYLMQSHPTPYYEMIATGKLLLRVTYQFHWMLSQREHIEFLMSHTAMMVKYLKASVEAMHSSMVVAMDWRNELNSNQLPRQDDIAVDWKDVEYLGNLLEWFLLISQSILQFIELYRSVIWTSSHYEAPRGSFRTMNHLELYTHRIVTKLLQVSQQYSLQISLDVKDNKAWFETIPSNLIFHKGSSADNDSKGWFDLNVDGFIQMKKRLIFQEPPNPHLLTSISQASEEKAPKDLDIQTPHDKLKQFLNEREHTIETNLDSLKQKIEIEEQLSHDSSDCWDTSDDDQEGFNAKSTANIQSTGWGLYG